jgi:sugar O-acyltransferase (sialic acid O-acetyltransferase NeuD family)
MRQAIFWGGTGQSKVLREALSGTDTTILAIFDNRAISSPFDDVPIFHGEQGLLSWRSGSDLIGRVYACVAIGGACGEDRVKLQRWLVSLGYESLTVVHPRAFVADDAKIGSGCQVLALAAVCAGSILGESVIVNTAASIDHDCIIGNGVHIAPGAKLAGEVVVENFAFVGTGAVVLPRIRIGTNAIVGAGAVVTKDVAAGMTVIGNPARQYERTP